MQKNSRIYRKHQKLPTNEATWTWEYLINKYNRGENITRYIEAETIRSLSVDLINSKNDPEIITAWVAKHLNPKLVTKLNQALRAKRKRFHDNEKLLLSKKTIDLEYSAWKTLSDTAKECNLSLSETVNLVFNLINLEQIQQELQNISTSNRDTLD